MLSYMQLFKLSTKLIEEKDNIKKCNLYHKYILSF